MRKDLVLSLQSKAKDIANNFSNPDRIYDGNKETFIIEKIIPLSESVAIIIFDKTPTGKKAIALCTYINSGEGYWQYCFPTYDHIAGWSRVDKYLHDVEVHNFEKN